MKKFASIVLAFALTVGFSVPAEAASTRTYTLKTFGWFKFPTTLTMSKKKNSCTNLTYTAKVTNVDMMFGDGTVQIRLDGGDILEGILWSTGDEDSYKASIPLCNYRAPSSKGYGPVKKGKYLLELIAYEAAFGNGSNAIGWITIR
jgi:hypothetical protein